MTEISSERSKIIGEMGITGLLWKFSIPSVVGMLVQALYNIVDSYFVGNFVGEKALTAVVVGFPLLIAQMAFTLMIAIGSVTIISIKLGEKKNEEAQNIFMNTIFMSIGFAVILTVIMIAFLPQLMTFSGAKGDILPLAMEFNKILTIGQILMFVGWMLNTIMRGEGNPRMSMITMIMGAVINACLNPLFIVFFKMGLKGSAYATLVTQFITMIWCISYFLGPNSVLKISLKRFIFKISTMLEIVKSGMPTFLINVVGSFIVVFFNNKLLLYSGETAVAAYGIINRIGMLFFMPAFGIVQGVQPIIGYNYGAKKYDRVIEATLKAILAGVIVTTIGFIFTHFFSEQTMAVFCDDPELVKIGSKGLFIVYLVMPVIGFQIVASTYFQAIHKPAIGSFLTLSRQVIILLPLLWIMPEYYGLNGIWMACPISDSISSIITFVCLYLSFIKLKTMDSAVQESDLSYQDKDII